jgi:hypothetical protein
VLRGSQFDAIWQRRAALKPARPLPERTAVAQPFRAATAVDNAEYDIVRVGGIKTSLFGGEGLFFAALSGPGRVWLQTLPFSRLADRINAAQRGDREEVKRDLGGMLGGVGDLIGGDR